MIVWGGSDDVEAEGTLGYPRSFLNTGAAYDPRTDTWRDLQPSPLTPTGWHSAVWSGHEMIVWGGTGGASGAGYDPATGRWRVLTDGPLSGRVDHRAVWTGEEMIVWGGGTSGGLSYDDGASYDPSADVWEVLPDAPISPRYRHAAVWTDHGLVVWGGQGDEVAGRVDLADGAVYSPA
jgi:hypothetical protein